MTAKATQVLQDALSLPPHERAAVAEELLTSLDRPDPQIDALWAAEAEARLAAHLDGRVPAIPAEDVFAEFEQA